jgi:hypothetical protein
MDDAGRDIPVAISMRDYLLATAAFLILATPVKAVTMKRERLSSRATAAANRAVPMSGRPSRPASPHGAPLDSALRGAFEPRFHFDFSNVQIHHDAGAHGVAGDVDARAVTMGSDIYFADGAYDPATIEGTELVAHELAHVVQRGKAGASLGIVSQASDTAEVEASHAAANAVTGGDVSLGGAAPAAVARKEEESESIFHRIGEMGELLKSPEDTGVVELLKGAGAPKGPLNAISPISGLLGMFGGADKAVEGAEKGDLLQTISGSTGLVGGGLGLAGWGAKAFGNEGVGGAFGGIGGLFSAGSNALDAVGDFRNGEYGKGALDTTKATAGGMSGLATLGGFELSTVADMGAWSALAGGGGEGLAALGPAGAVLGSGLAGYGAGTAMLGSANNYAKRNDIFGDHRDSTEAAADAGVAVQDYLHSTWVPDVVGDVAGGVTAVGSSIGTAAYSGLHAAGSAVSDFFSGPSILDLVQQRARSEEWAMKMKEDD